jgi:hypothetical protein
VVGIGRGFAGGAHFGDVSDRTFFVNRSVLIFAVGLCAVALVSCTPTGRAPTTAPATVTITATPTALTRAQVQDETQKDQQQWMASNSPTPLDDDAGVEAGDPDVTVAKGRIGVQLLVHDPTDQANTASINVFRVDRVLSDSLDYYRSTEASEFLSISVNIRVKTGVWETSSADWMLEPDADTGIPLYQAQGSIGRYDSKGDDRALYDGKVKAGKHVEGGVYFDAPTGTDFTLRYTPSFTWFSTGDDGIASWRIPK